MGPMRVRAPGALTVAAALFIPESDSYPRPQGRCISIRERSKNPATKKIARERIAILFREASLAFHENPAMSNRYVELARRIAMRQRIRIDRELRRQYCHRCAAFLVPGANMRVRVGRGSVVVTCLLCKKKTRYRVVRPDGRTK
jgi:ribonuclease P protein subunit RPR2